MGWMGWGSMGWKCQSQSDVIRHSCDLEIAGFVLDHSNLHLPSTRPELSCIE